MKKYVLLICLVLANAGALALEIEASPTNGTLSFAGKHAGMDFDGEFKDWESTITLPPAESPKIEATFQLASAETGDGTYDETLPEGDWFDVENHPTATFESKSIVVQGNGSFIVEGDLSLRGKALPVEFILEMEAGKLIADFTIDRLAYDIGRESDPEAEWVSRDINMNLLINLP